MENGNDDLDETAHGLTGTADAKGFTMIAKLRLVYGRAAGNEANDGDGASTDSQEFAIDQTGATGAADWVADATTAVEKLKAYLDLYNANTPAADASGELASDGYEAAYTELTGGSTPGDEYEGKCSTAVNNAVGHAADLTGEFDGSNPFNFAWVNETAAEFAGWVTGSEDAVLTLCAR